MSVYSTDCLDQFHGFLNLICYYSWAYFMQFFSSQIATLPKIEVNWRYIFPSHGKNRKLWNHHAHWCCMYWTPFNGNKCNNRPTKSHRTPPLLGSHKRPCQVGKWWHLANLHNRCATRLVGCFRQSLHFKMFQKIRNSETAHINTVNFMNSGAWKGLILSAQPLQDLPFETVLLLAIETNSLAKVPYIMGFISIWCT